MQTYTHLLVGAVVGGVAFPGEPLAQVACAAGAALPDVVQMPLYAVDKLLGRTPLASVPPSVLRLKDAAHSLLVWLALLAVSFGVGWLPFTTFCWGGLTHPPLDALTHKDPEYWSTDAGFLWPLRVRLARYTGVWDYRIAHGVLRPKPFEAAVDAAAVVFLIRLALG